MAINNNRSLFWLRSVSKNNVKGVADIIAGLALIFLFGNFIYEANAASVVVGGSSPTLSWVRSADSRVVGYYIKSGKVNDAITNVVDVHNVASFSLTTLFVGKTNFIFVTCYDIYHNESGPSQVIYYYPTSSVQMVAPAFTTQPASVAAVKGANVSFNAAATGTAPLSYQWFKNGAALTGATAPTLSLVNVQATNAGSYTVTVKNAAGAANSSAATLTLNIPPAILAQPVNTAAGQGTLVSISVTASGTAPLAYQWYKNGSAISWAKNSTIIFNSVQTGDVGSYTVRVTNLAGAVGSAAVNLVVNPAPSAASAIAKVSIIVPPAIFSQPNKQIVAAGSGAAFRVLANGTPPLHYQWTKEPLLQWMMNGYFALNILQPSDVANYLNYGIPGLIMNRWSVGNTNPSLEPDLPARAPHSLILTNKAPGLESEVSLSHHLTNTIRAAAVSGLAMKNYPTSASAGVFKFTTIPGTHYVIQVSEDLKTWKNVSTILSATSVETEFEDPASIKHGMRFYRAAIISDFPSKLQ